MRYLTLKSFRILNPDWQIILYTAKCQENNKSWKDDIDQDFFTYTGQNYFHKIHELDIEVHEWKLVDMPNARPSHLSNFLKWYKLQAHGGLYADMDILWLRSFDMLYDELREYDSAICITKYLSIGLLGSSIGNPMFKDFFSHARDYYNPNRYQSVGVENIYDILYGSRAFNDDGTVNFTFLSQQDILQDIKERYPDLKIFNIPFGMMYPFGCTEMNKVFNATYKLPDHIIGLHWYAGNPISQEYNGKLTEKNIHEYNNTFATYAGRYVR